MVVEEEITEILITITQKQALRFLEIRTIRITPQIEDQIQQTLAAKARQEPTRQAQEVTLILHQDHIILVQTLAIIVMEEDRLVVEEEEDNLKMNK